jgi:hypothetical protein
MELGKVSEEPLVVSMASPAVFVVSLVVSMAPSPIFVAQLMSAETTSGTIFSNEGVHLGLGFTQTPICWESASKI